MSAEFTPPRAGYLWYMAIASVAFFGFRTLSNSTFWIHLASGRLLAEQGWIRSDPFSFTTDTSRVWINATWLYDALLYRLWQMGGSPAVTIAFVCCVVAAFALLRPLVRDRASDANQALALLLIAWLIAPALSIGPHGPALLFAAFFIRMLSHARARTAALTLIPIQLAWTNMHASFLLGPALAVAFWFDRKNHPHARLPIWLPAALLAATLLNPYGIRLHQLAFSSVINPNTGALIEWVSPFHNEFAPFATRFAQTALLIVVASGFISIIGRLPTALTALGVAGAFLLVLSPRYVVFAGLFIFPFSSISLHGTSDWITRRLGTTLWEPAGRSLAAFAAALTLLLVSSGYYFNRTGSASTFGLGIARDVFPMRACESILARPDFPERALNLAQDGGYLAWALPHRKIFTDTRTPVYGASFYQGLGRALLIDNDVLANLLTRFNPGAIILNGAWPGAGQAARRLIDSGDWAPAYFDGITMVLLRTTRENARLLTDFETQRAGLRELENARRAYESELASLFPARNHARLIGAGTFYYSLWRFREAAAVLDPVTRGSPTYVTGWQNLGIALLNTGQTKEGARALEHAVRLRPRDALAYLWLGKAYESLNDPSRADRMRQKGKRFNPSLAESFEKEIAARGRLPAP